LLKDLRKELRGRDTYIGELEPRHCSPRENETSNAIMTNQAGAGGTESQIAASILCACISAGAKV